MITDKLKFCSICGPLDNKSTIGSAGAGQTCLVSKISCSCLGGNMSPIYFWSKLLKKLRGSAIVNTTIHKTSKVESGSHVVNTTFDKHSFCGYDCKIENCDIGSFCSIANHVIIGGAFHPMEWVSTSPVFYEGRDSVKAKFSIHKRESVKRTTTVWRLLTHDDKFPTSSIDKPWFP